jgi:phage tail tape-measure protein
MKNSLRSRLYREEDRESATGDAGSRYLAGRLGGAVAGGALGAIVGPTGAIALAVTGSLVGGEYERRVRSQSRGDS